MPVVVVEVSDDGRFVSPTRAAGIPVFVGDARHPEVLDELHIGTARAIVAATSDDLVNLIGGAQRARVARPDLRVVVRLYDPDFAVRVQRGFRIRFTRSVSHLAAPAFAAAAVGSEVVATVPVGDKRVILFARLRPEGSPRGPLASSSVGPVRCACWPSPTRARRTPLDLPVHEVSTRARSRGRRDRAGWRSCFTAASRRDPESLDGRSRRGVRSVTARPRRAGPSRSSSIRPRSAVTQPKRPT